MKHISKLKNKDLKDIKMIVFDVDGVLVPRGTKISTDGDTLTLQIKKIQPHLIEKIKALHDKGLHINISSGRSLFMLQEMFRDILEYVSITYENGSSTWFQGNIIQHINSFDELNNLKDLLPALKIFDNFKGFEPKEFIVTIHCKDRIIELEKDMACSNKNLYCLWNGEAYDIGIIDRQTKGFGLIELKEILIRKEILCFNTETLAIGDNYNDIELLEQANVKVTADKSRLKGDFYIDLEGKNLPGEVLIDKILEVLE